MGDDKFAPLTADELATAPVVPVDRSKFEVLMPPDGAEHIEAAAQRLCRRKPDGLWIYSTDNGSVAFGIVRLDKPDGDKDVKPVSWVRSDEGEGWAFKAWSKERPLYRLDALAANPDKPVVVCEGEKAADAAATLFRRSVCVTSSGGSGAALLSDWTPISGRKVMIWPDADAPGAKYGEAVAAILADLSCDVRVVDAAKLSALNPVTGGSRAIVKGWDAADAVADWQDHRALAKAVLDHSNTFMRVLPLGYVSTGPFKMSVKGLIFAKEKLKGDQTSIEEMKVCAALEVLGRVRDGKGEGWGKLLRWKDADGREHVYRLEDAALQGDPGPLCADMAGRGLWINRTHQRDLATYLSSVSVKDRVTIVSRSGWHEINGKPVFVLPDQVIGNAGERVILEAAARAL